MPEIYRCSEKCPIKKKCFVIKTLSKLRYPIKVLLKCPAKHNQDITVTIGGDRPP
jgi:hypothetical protein